MKKLAEILTGPETWCQGTLRRGKARCLIGGLFALDASALGHSEKRARLRLVIASRWDLPAPSYAGKDRIAAWQDAPERTWEDVAWVVSEFDRDAMLNP